MSITCLLSQTSNDARCPVCGQGFTVFAERSTATVREQVKRCVQRAMRGHHAGAQGALDVHPTTAFAVGEDNGGAADGWSGWVPAGTPAAAMAF